MIQSRADVVLLALLRAAPHQDHQPIAVFPEKILSPSPKSILYSNNPEPTPFTFEKLPPASRVRLVATFAAGWEFRRLNQSP
jgi:hypothetical protein